LRTAGGNRHGHSDDEIGQTKTLHDISILMHERRAKT
jgi:hypothetical protein